MTHSTAPRSVPNWQTAAAEGEECDLRIEHRQPLRPQGSVERGAGPGRDHLAVAQGEDVAAERHGIPVGNGNAADAVPRQPVHEAWVQHVEAGDGEAGGGHAEDHVEMQEMLVEELDPHLPALGAEPFRELLRPRLVGAAAAGADAGEAGADDVDVAALQRAGAGLAPEGGAMGGVEVGQRRVLAPALRAFELAEHRAGMGHDHAVAGIDHVGEVRLRHQPVHPRAALRQGVAELGMLLPQVIGRRALPRLAQRAADDAVQRHPAVVVWRADQHVVQAAGLVADAPGRAGMGEGGHAEQPRGAEPRPEASSRVP